MTFTETMIEKASGNPQRIALPEVDDPRVIELASEMQTMGIGIPVLVGDKKVIEDAAKAQGKSLGDAIIVDTSDEGHVASIAAECAQKSDRLSEKGWARKAKTPLNLACELVITGQADAVAAGLQHTTLDVVMAGQNLFGPAPGVETISSFGIVEGPQFDFLEDGFLGIADCAVNTNPTARQLADIAYSSAQSIHDLLGIEPRVALLSFSTKGSTEDPLAEKVIEALEIAHELFPDLLIDGELQFDAAIDRKVAARKVPGDSPVAGRANIAIFPDLNAGNIAVKLIQRFGGVSAHGPILQGLAAPITDFSRGAPLDEIMGNLAMLAVRSAAAKRA